MKKILPICILILFLFVLSACTKIEEIPQNQSTNNFQGYYDDIKELLEEKNYNYSIVEIPDDNVVEYTISKEYQIIIDDKSYIDIHLMNEGYDEPIGVERFEVYYHNKLNNLNDNVNKINVSLITDIVNLLSGRQITVEYCKTFLESPDDKFSPKRYGISKFDYELVSKYEFLNFGEDWSIGYTLNDDFTETLYFWGLTNSKS